MEKLLNKDEQTFVATANFVQIQIYTAENALTPDSEAILLYRICTFLQNNDTKLPGRHLKNVCSREKCRQAKELVRSYETGHGFSEEALKHLYREKNGSKRPAADYIFDLIRQLRGNLPHSVEK